MQDINRAEIARKAVELVYQLKAEEEKKDIVIIAHVAKREERETA